MNERKESTTSIILEYVRVIVLTVIATFIFLQFVQIQELMVQVWKILIFKIILFWLIKFFINIVNLKEMYYYCNDYDDGLDDTLIIKRVIAVGGDHLDIKNNEVYINGKKIKRKLH